MIPTPTLKAFREEIIKLSSKPITLTKGKAGLAAAGLLGGGMLLEQAKDDMLQGRRQRRDHARAMGMKHLVGLRT